MSGFFFPVATPQSCHSKDPNSEPGCGLCLSCTQQIEFHSNPNATCPNEICTPDTCRCKDGYFNDDITRSGKCIPLRQCWNELGTTTPVSHFPNCAAQDPNSQRGCGECIWCSQQIEKLAGKKPACPIGPCLPSSCTCKPGYYKDDISKSNKCVPLKQCLAEHQNPPYSCPTFQKPGCGPCKTCKNALAGNFNPPCPVLCVKNPCECVDGRYRDAAGNCLTLNECRLQTTTTPHPTTVTVKRKISVFIPHLSILIMNLKFLIPNLSFLISHLSFLISHFSLILSHFSPLVSRISFLISHVSFKTGTTRFYFSSTSL